MAQQLGIRFPYVHLIFIFVLIFFTLRTLHTSSINPKMKFTNVLPLAALSSAFVLPPAEVMNEIVVEDNHRGNVWYEDAEQVKDSILSGFKKHYEEVSETSKDAWKQITKTSKSAFDEAIEYGNEAADAVKDKIHEASECPLGLVLFTCTLVGSMR